MWTMLCSKTKKKNPLVLSPTQEFLNSQPARFLKLVKGVDFTPVLMLTEIRVMPPCIPSRGKRSEVH